MSDITAGLGAGSMAAVGSAGSGESPNRLISSDRVEGTAVYNRQGERLGSVHSLMIDKYTGQVAYAVMSFGGFLGIGDSYHPLPWSVLDYDTRMGGYVVDLDRASLEKAPSYTGSQGANWDDQSWGSSINDYYKASPYRGL